MKSVKVRDYMTTRLVSFAPDTNVVEAMDSFLKNRISGAPIVDAEGNMVGILSEVDLMQVVVQDSYYDESIGIVSVCSEPQSGHVIVDSSCASNIFITLINQIALYQFEWLLVNIQPVVTTETRHFLQLFNNDHDNNW